MTPAPWLVHLPLAWPLAKRDVLARYRGSVLGVAWALLGPLAMVAIYAAVFQGVFKARWLPGEAAAAGAAGDAGGLDYALRVFAGLIAFSAISEVASRAVRLIVDHGNLVKRVVFPLELLAVALLMQVAVHSALQVGLLALLLIAFGPGVQPSWAWLPLAFVWLLTIQFVLALLLAALGAYLRDLQHVVPLVMTGLMFLTPIFYPASAAPPLLAEILTLNPLTAPIEFLRAAWFGQPVAAYAPPLHLLVLALLLPLALQLFRRLRPGFADLV